MTILRALVAHYDQLMGEKDPSKRLPMYGFSLEKVSYAIVLSVEGKVVDVQPILDTSGKTPKPSIQLVPQAVIRTVGIVPNFLWDKTAYVFGVKRDNSTNGITKTDKENNSFQEFHGNLLRGTEDEGLTAFLKFLQAWRSEYFLELPHFDEMLDANVVFKLDSERRYLHETSAAKQVWQSHIESTAAKEGFSRPCLVTGEIAPSERLHSKIKGVRGAQSSGASIVSFNLNAFSSYGKVQGDNAPISKRAAFAYTTALNHMLAYNSRQRIQIGDTTTVFWAEVQDGGSRTNAAEDLFSMILDPSATDETETAEVSKKLDAISKGRPVSEIEPEIYENARFHVLGLAPNASRLSIRFWFVDSFGNLSRRIGEHWRDLRIEPIPWKTPPATWRLLRETAAQEKVENIQPALSGALMRAILTGTRYPHSLFAAVIARIRADKKITGLRVAICKACLARDHRLGFEKEDVPMSLNTEESNAAYRMGRLFAVYESIQLTALVNPNTTIKDRYFGAASATPASVFPLLSRNAMHHLASIRKGGKGGLAHWFEREIESIFDGIDTAFPRSLRFEDQGRFAIGYYHQKSRKRNKPGLIEDSTKPNEDGINDED